MDVRTIGILVIAVLVFVFVAQNTQVVDIRLLFWKISMSRALVLLATFGFGLLMGWLLGALPKRKE